MRDWLLRAVVVVLTLDASGCSDGPSAPSASPAGTVAISGSVRDLLPAGVGAPVQGVDIQAISSAGTAGSAVSGADGSFRIQGVTTATSVQLRASKAGYEAAVRSVGLLAGDVVVDIALTPIPLSLAGSITETAPTEHIGIAGATLEILTGSNAGRRVTTDRAGAYTLAPVWGEFDLSISRPEYETQIRHVATLTSTRLDVKLTPRDLRVRTTLSGDLCTVATIPSWLSCSNPFQRSHTIAVHRPGVLTLSLDYRYVGDYYPNTMTLAIRCGSGTVIEKKFSKHLTAPPTVDGAAGPIEVPLAQPCNYDVRVFDFVADTKGGAETTYRVEVAHP
jgi:hypothetical protein